MVDAHYTWRAITTADEPFLWEMLYLAIYVPPGAPPVSRAILQEPDIAIYVQGWGRPGDEGLIAVEQNSGKEAGACWLRLWTSEQRGYGFIDDHTPELSIALLPEHRQRGLGSHLISAMLEQARTRYDAVSLSVVQTSPAVRLYQRLGFRVEGEVLGSYIMVKRF